MKHRGRALSPCPAAPTRREPDREDLDAERAHLVQERLTIEIDDEREATGIRLVKTLGGS
jgi:hypothetical protein